MSEDTKEPENIAVSDQAKQPETEPQAEVTTSEPETVPEITAKTTGEAEAEPAVVDPKTETPQLGGNEPFGSFPKVDRTFGSDCEPKEQQPEPSRYERDEPLPEAVTDGA